MGMLESLTLVYRNADVSPIGAMKQLKHLALKPSSQNEWSMEEASWLSGLTQLLSLFFEAMPPVSLLSQVPASLRSFGVSNEFDKFAFEDFSRLAAWIRANRLPLLQHIEVESAVMPDPDIDLHVLGEQLSSWLAPPQLNFSIGTVHADANVEGLLYFSSKVPKVMRGVKQVSLGKAFQLTPLTVWELCVKTSKDCLHGIAA